VTEVLTPHNHSVHFITGLNLHGKMARNNPLRERCHFCLSFKNNNNYYYNKILIVKESQLAPMSAVTH